MYLPVFFIRVVLYYRLNFCSYIHFFNIHIFTFRTSYHRPTARLRRLSLVHQQPLPTLALLCKVTLAIVVAVVMGHLQCTNHQHSNLRVLFIHHIYLLKVLHIFISRLLAVGFLLYCLGLFLCVLTTLDFNYCSIC